MSMTTVGFLVLVLLGSLLIWIVLEVAKIPGMKARERHHPQADAINVLGWAGLLMGGVGWVVALVWAYTKPPLVVVVADASPREVGEAVHKALENDAQDKTSNS
ncbi:MAG: DUF3302 domain-containing protein [Deltaproteobacteria bacterium]|nr:DUF3302 domain-containing protein [Deltaproteobacteria bacterium]